MTAPRWLLLMSSEDGNPCSFLDADAHAELVADPDAWGVKTFLDAVPDQPDHNYWPNGQALLLKIEVVVPPTPDPEPKRPCPEGFHWIGQSFAHCDKCSLPAWDHEGIAALPEGAGPFGREPWVLKPWGPGDREACKAKWGPQ